jgi:hypothetical protein
VAFPTDWSPDDKFILYHRSVPETGWDVMLLPLSGDRTPIPFAQSKFNEVAGRFSPNGAWIAYASDESGRSEIYVKAFPRSDTGVIVSRGGGSEPRWGPGGTELFYLDPDGFLTVVKVSPAVKFNYEAPQRLFQIHVPLFGGIFGTNYDVAKDGRILVNTLVGRAAPKPITVVVNWTAGLKK